MTLKANLWTYALTTAVTVGVWSWAAGETRVDQTLDVQLNFAVDDARAWLIEPAPAEAVTVVAEGSQRSIRNATRTLQSIDIALPARTGSFARDLASLLQDHPTVEAAGIRIVRTEPVMLERTLDRLIDAPARVVLREMPGVEIVGAPTIDPAQITLRVPEQLIDPNVELTVTAIVNRADLAGRAPGVMHTLPSVPLELPEYLANHPAVRATPPETRIAFTIGSQIREVAPPVPVRVQLAGSPEDESRVEVEPKLLRDVTVRVTEDIGRRIESGEVTVIALVHLKSSEKEARIERKPVTAFVALLPDGTLKVVDARVGDDEDQYPMITLKITEKDD